MTKAMEEARALAVELGLRASREQIVYHHHARAADKLATALAARDAENERLREDITPADIRVAIDAFLDAGPNNHVHSNQMSAALQAVISRRAAGGQP